MSTPTGTFIITSRWPIRQGSKLIPKGTQGHYATSAEWARIVPNLHVDSRSTWAAVVFDGYEPMIIAAKEIETCWVRDEIAEPTPPPPP